MDAIYADDDPVSEHEHEQDTRADQPADTTSESTSDAESEPTESPPAGLDQPIDGLGDLATVVAEQQAAIDELDRRLAAHQQTIDELHATIETIQARLEQHTQATAPSTDNTEATGEKAETDSDDTSDA